MTTVPFIMPTITHFHDHNMPELAPFAALLLPPLFFLCRAPPAARWDSPAPGTLSAQVPRHWTRSPQTVPPDVPALASFGPSQFHSFPIGLQSVFSPSAFFTPYASCEFYTFPPGRQPHHPFLAISPHPNAAKFLPFPFNIQPLRPHLPLPAVHVTREFHFLAVCLHFFRACQALHPLPAPEHFSPSPTVIRRPGPPAPSPLLDPPPSPAACSQPALPAAGPALAPRSPSTVNLSNSTVTAFTAPEGSWSPCSTHLELRFALCGRQNSRQPPPPTPGYTLVRHDRPGGGGGGGLAFLIRQDVQFSHLDTNQFFPGDPTTEHQGILANLGGHQIACLNIYIPPCTCCPAGLQPDLAPLLDADVLVMGDFNAHHPAWFSVSRDDRASEPPLPPKWGLPDLGCRQMAPPRPLTLP